MQVALAPKVSRGQKGLLYESHDYAALGRAANGALLMTYEWGYNAGPPMAVAPLDKVRQVVGKADLIQSVGSTELLQEIEKAAGRLELCQDILLEVNIGGEAAKSGFAPEDIAAAAETALAMPHVRVRGLMTIPPVAMEPHGNLAYFEKMRWLYVDINAKIYDNKMEYLSMGMSGDFADAIRCGSNMIRVGTAIFGARDYTK